MHWDAPSLFDEFQLSGEWWVPRSPENRIHGTLFYKGADKIRLELEGALQEPTTGRVRRIVATLPAFGVILGASSDGREYTLVDAFEVSGKGLLSGGVTQSTVIGHRLYLGCHFASKPDVQFEEQTVEYTYLTEWLGHNPFEMILPVKAGETTIRLPYSKREIFRVRIPDQGALVSLHSSLAFGTTIFKKVECTHRVFVSIQPDHSRPDEWFQEFRRNLDNLFTLFIGEAVYPRRITGWRDVRDVAGNHRNNEVRVYLSLLEPGVRESLHPAEMPVPYAKIEERASAVIAAWFSSAGRLEPVHSLFFGTYYNRRMYLESEFLTLMQALEIFHDMQIAGSYLSSEEWQPHYHALVAAIPGELTRDHKDSLRNRLQYGYQYSLRKRMERLLDTLPPNLRTRITSDIAGFVRDCIETRNGLTHGGPQGILARGLEALWETNQKLRAMTAILLLHTIGIREEDVAERVFASIR